MSKTEVKKTNVKNEPTKTVKKFTKDELVKKFKELGYNMLNIEETAQKCFENPNKEYKDLKVLSHKALGMVKRQ